MNRTYPKNDLLWSLASFERPKSAIEFFSRFNNAFAVYSNSVNKIYTEYETQLVQRGQPYMVIQPDLQNFTSLFHRIRPEAIRRSNVVVFETGNELRISGVSAISNTRRNYTFRDGLVEIFSGGFTDGAFLPLVTYGDLRVLPEHSAPILQLHYLDIARLGDMGEFQLNDLISTMKQNLIARLN